MRNEPKNAIKSKFFIQEQYKFQDFYAQWN